jgi:hypothetical protein
MHQGRLVFAQAQTSTRPARSTVAKTVNERREAMLTLHNLGGEDNGWVRTEGRVLFGVEVFPPIASPTDTCPFVEKGSVCLYQDNIVVIRQVGLSRNPFAQLSSGVRESGGSPSP